VQNGLEFDFLFKMPNSYVNLNLILNRDNKVNK